MLSTNRVYKRQNRFGKLRVIKLVACWFSMALAYSSAHAESAQQATIAIVIDDLGHHLERGRTLNKLPYPLTFAFLPERRYTSTLAKQAYHAGKEVILHAPMENARQFHLGAGALTTNMSPIELGETLQKSLTSIPFVSGMNNHMGSTFTAHQASMESVLSTLSHYPYYFLDSKTTASSVAAKVSRSMKIPTFVRDVFLDHENSLEHIAQQFEQLIALAKKNGSAIAIGHPYPNTIQFLQNTLPTLGEQGISIATLSGLWQVRHPHQAMFSSEKTLSTNQLAFSGDF